MLGLQIWSKRCFSVQRVLFAYGAQLLPAEQLCKCKWLNLFCCILQNADSDPDQELTDAAATAQSLQPRGFTLETTDVRIRLLLNVLCYVTWRQEKDVKKRAVNWMNPTKGGSFKTIFGFKVSLWLGWWMMNFKFPPTNPLLLSPILVIEIDVWLISLLSWRWYVTQFCQTTPSLCLNNLPILLFKISSSFRLRPKCHSCCEVSLENISLLA